jgi:hypothetical protein
MAALTPRARALVKAGQAAFRPEEADLARATAALEARLGAGTLPAEAPPAPPSATAPPPAVAPPALAGAWVVPGVAACVLLAGSALVIARWTGTGTESPAVPPAARSVTLAPPPVEIANLPAPPAPVNEAEAPAEPVAAAPEAQAPAPLRAKDRLAEEVALLSQATSALRAGRIGDALRSLDEHQRRFPGGALREERRAARAQALCASKRVTEGRAELAHLSPGSPAAVRARQVCDANGGKER